MVQYTTLFYPPDLPKGYVVTLNRIVKLELKPTCLVMNKQRIENSQFLKLIGEWKTEGRILAKA